MVGSMVKLGSGTLTLPFSERQAGTKEGRVKRFEDLSFENSILRQQTICRTKSDPPWRGRAGEGKGS
jgi:hypothetical protein